MPNIIKIPRSLQAYLVFFWSYSSNTPSYIFKYLWDFLTSINCRRIFFPIVIIYQCWVCLLIYIKPVPYGFRFITSRWYNFPLHALHISSFFGTIENYIENLRRIYTFFSPIGALSVLIITEMLRTTSTFFPDSVKIICMHQLRDRPGIASNMNPALQSSLDSLSWSE